MPSRIDYTGRRYGLVTVLRREGKKTWVRCDCGCVRSAAISNLISAPPKSHSKCYEFQYDLPFDNVRKQPYKGAS